MKNAQVKKLSSRQKQKIKVLISKPDFINAISELRKKWNIPKDGFKDQSLLDKWRQQLELNTQAYFDNELPSERKKLLEIKNQGDHNKYRKLLNDFNNKVPKNAFIRDIKKLAKDQKLSPRWVEGIRRYILTNDADRMGVFIGPVISTKIDFEFDTQVISIEIDADTTLSDIKAIWPSVKSAQKNLQYKTQDKFQPLRQFDRNKKAYELQQRGMKYEEIAKELSTNGDQYEYEEVGKMIERYKKKVDIS
jgi:hypothetical protein